MDGGKIMWRRTERYVFMLTSPSKRQKLLLLPIEKLRKAEKLMALGKTASQPETSSELPW